MEQALKHYANKEAIVCNDRRFTYEEFDSRVARLAGYLQKQGIRKGDVVSILHYNCHCYLEAYFAAALSGAILNSINVRLSPREIKYILQDSESKLLITNQRYAEQLRKVDYAFGSIIWTGTDLPKALPGKYYEDIIDGGAFDDFIPVSVHKHDVAHLYYTSGTTGKPKGVPLSHENVTIHSLWAIEEFDISERDNWLHAAPMFHLADAWASFALTYAGAQHTMLNDFREQEAFTAIEKEQVTISNMIPTMLNMLIHYNGIEKYDLAGLRVILSGGAPIAPQLVREIMEKFGCDYIQTYGMTETCPYLTISKLHDHLQRLPFEDQLHYKAKTGRPFAGVRMRVVTDNGNDVTPNGEDVGEIIVKGDTVTSGYWNLPEETGKTIVDGWLHTGDMATIDGEGYVNIVDRKKDIIITGGENVYSTEVEYVIYEHPAVLEVAVVGIPDKKWGEVVKAFVVLKGEITASEEEIICFVKERIASFKAPKAVAFIDALPKTGSGKITKRALRDRM